MYIKKILLKKNDLHVSRKAWHIITGLLGLIIYFNVDVNHKDFGHGLLAMGVSSLIFESIRLKNSNINELVIKYMGVFMRESEKTSLTGLPFYAIGVGLSLVLFHEPFAILSVMLLVFSDPISSAFGIKFGTQKIYGNKSLEGTLAGFITCFIIVLGYGILFFNINVNLFAFTLISASAASLTELFSTKIDDNLSIPLVSGAVMTILNMITPVI